MGIDWKLICPKFDSMISKYLKLVAMEVKWKKYILNVDSIYLVTRKGIEDTCFL